MHACFEAWVHLISAIDLTLNDLRLKFSQTVWKLERMWEEVYQVIWGSVQTPPEGAGWMCNWVYIELNPNCYRLNYYFANHSLKASSPHFFLQWKSRFAIIRLSTIGTIWRPTKGNQKFNITLVESIFAHLCFQKKWRKLLCYWSSHNS